MSNQSLAAAPSERMILPLDRDYLFLGVVVSIVFVGVGFWIVQPPAESGAQFWGDATIFIFGILGIIRFVQMIAPQLSFIELADNGFRITNAFRRHQQPLIPWSDVDKITAYQWYGFRGGWHKGVRISRRSTFAETKIAVPRKYGYTAEDLAALFTDFRDRAMQTGAAPAK